MRRTLPALLVLCGLGLVLSLLSNAQRSQTASPASREEPLRRLINLGKAFYENPTTQSEAAETFRQALALAPESAKEKLNYGLALLRAGKTPEGVALLQEVQKREPSLPHTWFNLGVVYKKDGSFDRSIQQFEQMARLVPNEPITRYNLGALYRLTNRPQEAIAQFEQAARLDESLAAPHFQLFNLYRQAGRSQDAQRALAVFQARKKAQEGSATPEDMEWSAYSEVYEPIPPATEELREPTATPSFRFQTLAEGLDPENADLTVADLDGDRRPDLLVVSGGKLRVFSGTGVAMRLGLESVTGVMSVAIGDYNNDALVDMCVLTHSGPRLFTNAKGQFQPSTSVLGSARHQAAVWMDYDHDYDLDLFLFGAQSALYRNQGAAGFIDQTAAFPFAPGEAVSAVQFRKLADSKTKDLLVAYRDRPGTLYADRLTGRYEATAFPSLPAGATGLRAADLDANSQLDILYLLGGKAGLLLNEGNRFGTAELPVSGVRQLAMLDAGNRGRLDLAGGGLWRNAGSGRFQPWTATLPAGPVWAALDGNADGRTDLAVVTRDGKLSLGTNATQGGAFLRVHLKGVKNLTLAPDAEVEVKAGTLYQKRVYQGQPLTFGLRGVRQIETVRITWPNGLIQNETRVNTGQLVSYEEAQRLSGSCPLIFTWNGLEFEYITDVLGVAPLGASSGDGSYFPTDHDEYVAIAGSQLAARDGTYEVRMTEELSEVTYLDRLRLIAVDHPNGIDVMTAERWKAPPFPEFRLFGVADRHHPVSARGQRGEDLRTQVRKRDRLYATHFRRDWQGVAEPHSLTLDFGPDAARDGRAVLVLHGWVDWADGSTFLNQAQQGTGLQPPSLQVRDADGRWRTVISDMGMPSGKPKQIAVDLTGKFLSASREVRILTNLCVYWDEIYLGDVDASPEVRLSTLDPVRADLRFRGFSPSTVHPQRKQPETFRYPDPQPTSLWNPTPGLYTRYGDVEPLLRAEDDQLVVFGSGDEVAVRFPANTLPRLPEGWRRDWLLHVDGWAKDRDANTAHSQTVEPLPFHRMSTYPYPASERYPDLAALTDYRRRYNTRPALRLLRPLVP